MADPRLVLAAALALLAGAAGAHTLGIDRATLVETAPGRYALRSIVPRSLAPAIATPVLPERCAHTGRPEGRVGAYEVRFDFVCDPPLSAGDGVELPWSREGAMLTVRWADGTESTRLVEREGGAMFVDLERFRAGSGSWPGAMRRYTALGFEHILAGIDHLLFVLALLFVVRSTWQLVKTITAFTVAHSITLALASLGYVSLPPAPVESAIALSIVFLCAEIERARQGRTGLTFSQPWLVAFVFGLLHGLGFAGALSEIGLPPGEVPLALAFFNVGVELGQLAFVGFALPALWLLRRRAALALAGERLVVYGAGTVATVWFVERAAAIAPS